MQSTRVLVSQRMGKGVGRECPVCEEEGVGVQEGDCCEGGRIRVEQGQGGTRCPQARLSNKVYLVQ